MHHTELTEHEHYMHTCLALGKKAKEGGDSPVGAIIVQNGTIIGEGTEGGKSNHDITFHAEIEAIRAATKHRSSQDLSGCTMYSTHEPCIMCSYVIRHTRIQTVVIGLSTGDIGGISSHYPLLSDTTIKKWGSPPLLITGILEEACRDI